MVGTVDFDSVHDYRGTHSLKWDSHEKMKKPSNLLPLWVADMDFQVLPEVEDALVALAKSGHYGYSMTCEGHHEAVQDWMQQRHDWHIEPEWITVTCGVVFSFSLAIRTLTDEGDAVLIQSPVYYPFSMAIEDNRRRLVDSPLRLVDGHYEIDFDDMEAKMKSEKVKAFLLCSPHNPVGRVWTREELQRMADLCEQYGVAVISDEIHHDLVFAPHRHTPFSNLSGQSAKNSIICTAPSKTFNLAGLAHANVIISDLDLRRKFRRELRAVGMSDHATFSSVACREAYRHGAPWVDQLLAYLRGNVDYLRVRLSEEMPRLKLIEPEGLYLTWVDARDLGLNNEELEKFMIEDAALWLDEGYIFGDAGSGFERFNLACPRATLAEALDRLAAAYRKRGF